MLSESSGGDGSQRGSRYVDADEIVDNQQALKALDGFIDRLQSSARPVSTGLVESAQAAILNPVDQSIQDQRRLIRQIQDDLRQTEAQQQDTRDALAAQKERVAALRGRYEALMGEIEALAG